MTGRSSRLGEFIAHPGASSEAITGAEGLLGMLLPSEYAEFLKVANGGEGYIGRQYVNFWKVEDLACMNQAYEVAANALGLLIIGSSGGGEAYGFDTRTLPWRVVRVPFVGLEWQEAEPAGESFLAFLKALQALP